MHACNPKDDLRQQLHLYYRTIIIGLNRHDMKTRTSGCFLSFHVSDGNRGSMLCWWNSFDVTCLWTLKKQPNDNTITSQRNGWEGMGVIHCTEGKNQVNFCVHFQTFEIWQQGIVYLYFIEILLVSSHHDYCFTLCPTAIKAPFFLEVLQAYYTRLFLKGETSL